MNKLRISLAELLMLVAIVAILTSFGLHVHRQASTREIVWAIEFSPDRKLLARASDLEVAVFDLSAQRLIAKLDVVAGCVAFSPDSKRIATGGFDGGVKVWDLATCAAYCSIRGHSGWVRSIAFSPDGSRLYSASEDPVAKAWQLPDGDLVGAFHAKAGDIQSMAVSPNGKILATGSSVMNSGRHDIELWNTETRNSITTLVGPEYCYVQKLSFSPDNRALATGLSVPMVRLWDVANGTVRAALPDAQGGSLVAYSHSGELLATSYYGGVQIWDAVTGAQVASLDGHFGEVLAAAFSRDESAVTTAGADGMVVTWNLASAQPVDRILGLTLRPNPIPWTALIGIGTWTIAWSILAFRTRHRQEADAVERSVKGFILVLFAAAFFVANGLSIIWLRPIEGSGPDPIAFMFWSSILSFAALLGVGLTPAFRAIRGRAVFWVISVSILMAALWYDVHLLVAIVASV